MIKKLSVLLTLFSLILSLISCDGDKIFGHAELRISLDESFLEFEAEGFDKAYSNGNAVVGILRISYEAGFDTGLPDFLTAEQFAKFYMQESGRVSEIKTVGTTPYYEYSVTEGAVRTRNLASFFRSKYAYFTVIFASTEENYQSLTAEFLSYAESVIFVY